MTPSRRVIAVGARKGGVGKSAVALNLAGTHARGPGIAASARECGAPAICWLKWAEVSQPGGVESGSVEEKGEG